jgi:hypothetical protein
METAMSRNFATLAAVCAFSALLVAGSAAQAQGTMDRGGMSGSGMNSGGMTSGGMSGGGAMNAPQAGSGDMSGRPMASGSHRAMRHERHMQRRGERRQMRADRRAAENPDGAYMGGGGVFERAPDGSLRPAM